MAQGILLDLPTSETVSVEKAFTSCGTPFTATMSTLLDPGVAGKVFVHARRPVSNDGWGRPGPSAD